MRKAPFQDSLNTIDDGFFTYCGLIYFASLAFQIADTKNRAF